MAALDLKNGTGQNFVHTLKLIVVCLNKLISVDIKRPFPPICSLFHMTSLASSINFAT